MNEEMNKPVEEIPQPQPQPASAPKAYRPRLVWKAVEPRHYKQAQAIKADKGKTAYNAYVVRLVERLDGEEPNEPNKAQVEAIVAAFEEKFGKND